MILRIKSRFDNFDENGNPRCLLILEGKISEEDKIQLELWGIRFQDLELVEKTGEKSK